ncbi:MAG: hypothetical protein NTV72_02995 [Candidatus Taylorbacteria bacterium]|nr:hypothetical protein [Candidatus Taylorbacteria bacterium]
MSLLQTILLVVVVIVVLSYIGFDIKGAIESDQSKKNFGYVKAVTVTVWERYLKSPAEYLYNNIFLEWIWKPTYNNLKKLRNGQSTDIQDNAPKMPAPNLTN